MRAPMNAPSRDARSGAPASAGIPSLLITRRHAHREKRFVQRVEISHFRSAERTALRCARAFARRAPARARLARRVLRNERRRLHPPTERGMRIWTTTAQGLPDEDEAIQFMIR